VAGSRPHHRLRDRSVECELKFRVEGPRDHARLRSLLRKRGAKLEGKYDEENYRFRGPGKSTRRTTLRLRVLDGGPHGVLTAKGPARFVGGVKIREETEVDVKDVHATLDLLSQLGFQVEFTYKKHRAMWTLDGVVSVTLDTLEFGSFVELEGQLEVLPEKARSLDFGPEGRAQGLLLRAGAEASRGDEEVLGSKWHQRRTANSAPAPRVPGPRQRPDACRCPQL
jgi:predicted adenylyl cyclase CyaB